MSDDAKANFEKLVKDNNFDVLGPESKIAILCQVKYHPRALSIRWLTQLCARPSFSRPLGSHPAKPVTPEQLLEHRQRLAKLVAYAGDYYKAENPDGRQILANSYDRLLERGGVDFRFEPKLPDSIEGEHHKSTGIDDPEVILLNPRSIPAGNGPLPADREKLAVDTVPHEVNHYANRGFGGFVGESRAFWAGFQSWNQRTPTKAEMLDICNKVVDKYPEIHSDIKTNNQKTDSGKTRAQFERAAYAAYIKLLKTGKPDDPAPPPVTWANADPELAKKFPEIAALDHENLYNAPPW